MTEVVDVDMAVVALLIHEAVVPLIREAVVVGLAEVVGLTFEAEEAVLVEALVAAGSRGGKLSKCNYLRKACC